MNFELVFYHARYAIFFAVPETIPKKLFTLSFFVKKRKKIVNQT